HYSCRVHRSSKCCETPGHKNHNTQQRESDSLAGAGGSSTHSSKLGCKVNPENRRQPDDPDDRRPPTYTVADPRAAPVVKLSVNAQDSNSQGDQRRDQNQTRYGKARAIICCCHKFSFRGVISRFPPRSSPIAGMADSLSDLQGTACLTWLATMVSDSSRFSSGTQGF